MIVIRLHLAHSNSSRSHPLAADPTLESHEEGFEIDAAPTLEVDLQEELGEQLLCEVLGKPTSPRAPSAAVIEQWILKSKGTRQW